MKKGLILSILMILFISCVSAVWWNPTTWDFGNKINLSPPYEDPTTLPNMPINPNIPTAYNNPTIPPTPSTQTTPTTPIKITEPQSNIVNTIPTTVQSDTITPSASNTPTTTQSPPATPTPTTITIPPSQKDTGSNINKVDTTTFTPTIPQSVKEQLKAECIYNKGGYSCGPRAIKTTLFKFEIEYTTEEINKLRNEGGGFLRTTFSLFNKGANQITWPSEMKDTLKHYGLEVKTISNNQELIRRTLEDQRDVVIISRIKEKAPFTDHWAVLDINDEGRTIINDRTNLQGTVLPSPNIEILETWAVTKPKTN